MSGSGRASLECQKATPLFQRSTVNVSACTLLKIAVVRAKKFMFRSYPRYDQYSSNKCSYLNLRMCNVVFPPWSKNDGLVVNNTYRSIVGGLCYMYIASQSDITGQCRQNWLARNFSSSMNATKGNYLLLAL